MGNSSQWGHKGVTTLVRSSGGMYLVSSYVFESSRVKTAHDRNYPALPYICTAARNHQSEFFEEHDITGRGQVCLESSRQRTHSMH